jgi:hypothetical protein
MAAHIPRQPQTAIPAISPAEVVLESTRRGGTTTATSTTATTVASCASGCLAIATFASGLGTGTCAAATTTATPSLGARARGAMLTLGHRHGMERAGRYAHDAIVTVQTLH